MPTIEEIMSAIQEILSDKLKHVQIANIIRRQIQSGALKNGSRLLPDEKLALKYKVNRNTIAAGLSTLVKEGLLDRAPRRGTLVIKDIKKGKTVSNAVGLVMSSEGDVFGNIFRGISKGFFRHDPVLIDGQVINDYDSLVQFLDSLISEQVKPYGFLIDGSASFPFDFFKTRIDSFRNTVFINRFNHPLVDLAEAGRIAARHFIAMGHTKISCLAIPEHYCGAWSSVQVPIMTGFAEVCHENDIRFSDEIFWALLRGAPFDSTVGPMLRKKDRPTAIFLYFDFFVRDRVIPLLESNGLKPMEDVELIGFYNTHHAEECGFSSISIQEEKIAEAAVKLLTSETDEREILIKPELVVREGNRYKSVVGGQWSGIRGQEEMTDDSEQTAGFRKKTVHGPTVLSG
jgi:DNA-binding LacI/PurR family transcriptional regulator